MAGSTSRRLVLALTVDASGVSPGFADAQKQATEFTGKIAQINAAAKNIRDEFNKSGLKDDPETKAAYEQAQQLLKYKKTYYQSLNELRLQDMELERAQLQQHSSLVEARVQADLAAEAKLRGTNLENQQAQVVAIQNVRGQIAAMDAFRQETQARQTASAKRAAERQYEDEHQASMKIRADQSADLEARVNAFSEAMDSDSNARAGSEAKESSYEKRRREGVLVIQGMQMTALKQYAEAEAAAAAKTKNAWDFSKAMISGGGRGDGGGVSGSGGGQGGFGAGWMKRMAAMDIVSTAADVVAPGMGGPLGKAAYFGEGGTSAMMVVGGIAAAVGIVAKGIDNWREGVEATARAQIEFNSQLDTTRLKMQAMAQDTEKLGPTVDRFRSLQRENEQQKIGEMRKYADAAASYAAILPPLRLIEGAPYLAQMSAAKQGIMYDEAQGQILDPFTSQATGTSRARLSQDLALAQLFGSQNASMAARRAGLAGMEGGPAREQATALLDAQQRSMELSQKERHDELQHQRDLNDAPKIARAAVEANNVGKVGYSWWNDPDYQKQLDNTLATANKIYGVTQADNDAKAKINAAQDAADQKRIELEQKLFDRRQENDLAMAKIEGEADPLQRRIDQQKQENSLKLDELQLSLNLTDAQKEQNAAYQKQQQIGEQILKNLDRETTYEQRMLDIQHAKNALDVQDLYRRTAISAADADLANQQRLLQSQGMTWAADQKQIEREKLEAKMAGADVASAGAGVGLAGASLFAALLHGDKNQISSAWGQMQEALARYGAEQQKLNEADKRWQTDKQVLQNEHERAVKNELQDVLDATAVAEGKMKPLQAEREKYERDHPVDPSDKDAVARQKAGLDQLYAAKQQQTDAEFAKQIKERAIDVAARYGMSPMEADYLRLKLDHPDVSGPLLKEMALLDRIKNGGELSTKYTMGETNFGALRGEITLNGAPPSWASGQGTAGFGSPFDSAAAMDSLKNARASALSVFRNPLQPGGSHTLNSLNSDNPTDRTNLILSRLERLLEKIENNTAELKL
jgi:hypothetical protein